MTIDFGGIKNYNPDRGFGFVGRTFLNPDGKVFFHIKKIRIKYPELAQKLDGREPFETVNLWYEIETTEKGDQVNKLWLNADNILQSYTHELPGLIEKVESIWKNVASPKPSWLDHVTTELVGVDGRHELSVERDNLESQLKAAEEERCREAEALRENEKRDKLESQLRAAEEKRRWDAEPENEIAKLAKKYGLEIAEASQLYLLLREMRPLKFKNTKELSAYIVRHKLGYRYPSISGLVTMEDGGTTWPFAGGFPPEIYKIICQELGLANQGTSARAIKFISYQQLLNRSR
jgi:cold shock CspA family protein